MVVDVGTLGWVLGLLPAALTTNGTNVAWVDGGFFNVKYPKHGKICLVL